MPTKKTIYFQNNTTVKIPGHGKVVASRLAFPLLSLLSRKQSLKLNLTPIDDERVIMALKYARGKVLDIGCGSNIFVRSYGNGIGVDVFPWEGCDQVIQDASKLPFPEASFGSVSYLACLNHIPERSESIKDAYRTLQPGGQLLITMVSPRFGQFIHWLRAKHDPDQKARIIDHDHELLGISDSEIRKLVEAAGFKNLRKRRFVYGMNNLYLANKP